MFYGCLICISYLRTYFHLAAVFFHSYTGFANTVTSFLEDWFIESVWLYLEWIYIHAAKCVYFVVKFKAVFNTVNAFVDLVFKFQGEHKSEKHYVKPYQHMSKAGAQRTVFRAHSLLLCIRLDRHVFQVQIHHFVSFM